MDLFSKPPVHKKTDEPLASRMRPKTLDELLGQEHLVGKDTPLRRTIEQDNLSSMILWGPPGSGKTTLAYIISKITSAHFHQFSAVTAGVADVRKATSEAKARRDYQGEKTILFVDEVHRFNKAQQDAFLPFVEDGTIALIGATTENPFFEVNSALLSRCKLYQLRPLTFDDVRAIVQRALNDEERGLGKYKSEIEENAVNFIANIADGDGRVALNALELSVLATKPDEKGTRKVTLETVQQATQKRSLTYDKNGDAHYDTISAFIKSMRGSDPDAALYWLARMIAGGEDPRFIARRMVICAAEDVGNADPQALMVATAAAHAVEYVGMPEAQIPMAQAAAYIASAPKSNAAYLGISSALSDVENLPNEPVPVHLRDASYRGAKRLGHQKDYKYPHNFKDHYLEQTYVPENIKGKTYYEPTDQGEEAKIKEGLRKLRGKEGERREA